MRKKNGMSAVVAIVLTILITVAAVLLLWNFVIPVVQQSSILNDPASRISIVTNDGYTYVATNEDCTISVQLDRTAGDVDTEITKAKLILNFGGTTREVYVNAPGRNQVRTYCYDLSKIGCEPDSISVAPIFNIGNEWKEGSVISTADLREGIIPDGTDCKVVGVNECVEDEEKECGDTNNVGQCHLGNKVCTATEGGAWLWGPCEGAIYPEEEICDGIDNNCADGTDEGCKGDCDVGDDPIDQTIGECVGYQICLDDGSLSATIWEDEAPGDNDEICDIGLRDEDCDGAINEGLTTETTCGVGICSGNVGSIECVNGESTVDSCDPLEGAEIEACDELGLNEDCDASANEGCVGECNFGDVPISCSLGECFGVQSCFEDGSLSDCVWTDTAPGDDDEICDDKDNDCDGVKDEDLTQATTCGVGLCFGNTGTEICANGDWGSNTCNPFAVCDECSDLDLSGCGSDLCRTYSCAAGDCVSEPKCGVGLTCDPSTGDCITPCAAGEVSYDGGYAIDVNALGCGMRLRTSGTYVLTEDLYRSETDASICVSIEENDIVFDMQGYRLIGTEGGGTEYGIDVSDNTYRLVVKNGVISGFYWGIHSGVGMKYSNWTNVEVVDSDYNSWGVEGGAAYNHFTNLSVLNSGKYGMGVSGYRNVFTNLILSNGGADSRALSVSGDYNNVTNVVMSGFTNGLQLYGSENNILKNITAYGNTGHSLILTSAANNNEISDSTFCGGGDVFIFTQFPYTSLYSTGCSGDGNVFDSVDGDCDGWPVLGTHYESCP